MDQFTTIDHPYFEGPGDILISAIDILPTELGKWLYVLICVRFRTIL